MMISEKQFASQVEDLLDIHSWRWVHFRPARVRRHGQDTYETAYTGYKGFPDYVAVKGTRIIFAELKSEKGKVSPKQQEWLDALMEANRGRIREGLSPCCEVYLWRPDQIEEIAEILR